MDRSEIKTALRKLPVEASAALAVRMGLRVLPWLAIGNDGRVLARWPEQERAGYLLAVLLAYDVGVMAVWNRKALKFREVARARRAAANGAVDDAGYAAAAAAATAYGVATAAAAAAAADATAAAAAAYRIIFEIDIVVKNDLEMLRNGSAQALIQSPLWPDELPESWMKQLLQFQTAVRSLDVGFDIWLDWYDARCRGDAIDIEQLQQRVFVPDSIDGQSPQEINA